ncbi:hypothetical protein GZH46_02800 [Fragariocoptes setiger]|uniref:Odorant receptor n=1 Tax=Fragariocoptes setiger TaxID=1670756 RepID=A0ABQ7S5K3_9ACAR|nr:hypothetical protein GZH46_02800 [Fragariocoptes setiger]
MSKVYIDELFGKIDTALLASYQFTCDEQYYFHRREPHKRYFPRLLGRLYIGLRSYVAIKIILLTQLIGFSIQLKRNEPVNYWWLRVYNQECSRPSHSNLPSDTASTSDFASISHNCSRLVLFRKLNLDLHELIKWFGDPYRRMGNDRISTYCLMAVLAFVVAVISPVSRMLYQYKYRYLEYAFDPQQALQWQAQYLYKHQANIKHIHDSFNKLDYYHSRPYVRTDDWLKWSVRVRVVITLFGQASITTLIVIVNIMPFNQASVNSNSQDSTVFTSFTWQDYLMLADLWSIIAFGTMLICAASQWLVCPIVELSFWLDEIQLQLVTCTVLMRSSRHHSRQVRYSLANALDIDDIMPINHRRSLAVREDCRITSLPHFYKIFKLNTRKRYQQLMLHSTAVNCCLTTDELLANVYFNFYLFVYEFESINELIRSLYPIIFSILSAEFNLKRHKIWISVVQRYFVSNNHRLGFRVLGYAISYQRFLEVNVYLTSVLLLAYSELLRRRCKSYDNLG